MIRVTCGPCERDGQLTHDVVAVIELGAVSPLIGYPCPVGCGRYYIVDDAPAGVVALLLDATPSVRRVSLLDPVPP